MPDEEVRALTARRHVEQASAIAAERAPETVELLYAADDPDVAIARLMPDWVMDEVQADAIPATKGGKYTTKERTQTLCRAEHLQRLLRQLSALPRSDRTP